MQPVNINEAAFVKQLQLLSPDCIVVVAFGQFLSIPIINLPGYRCINIHASLLPKLRRAAPINWAIIRGERITGVTSVVMTAKWMRVTLLPKNNPYISRENARELEERLASMGATLLIDTLKSIETGNATYTKQDEKR